VDDHIQQADVLTGASPLAPTKPTSSVIVFEREIKLPSSARLAVVGRVTIFERFHHSRLHTQ
jgi:hypothetical protein